MYACDAFIRGRDALSNLLWEASHPSMKISWKADPSFHDPSIITEPATGKALYNLLLCELRSRTGHAIYIAWPSTAHANLTGLLPGIDFRKRCHELEI